ncbi:Rab GTPase-activating protein 1-like [Liparis tanakae]|uniref:Rab GTPase-activating protein 1-like n=1 Tax=Liparis tanakae TaxID=230148 RepID=A0A4Z2ED28_9TELE|nr:Rab GTPase-activating protein 1-like [Liparis tanakae]
MFPLVLSFPLQVSRILYSFSTAFRRSSRPADIRDTSLSSLPDGDLYTFTVTLEIKEDDGKAHYSPVPKDRDKFYFKLRQGVQKKVVEAGLLRDEMMMMMMMMMMMIMMIMMMMMITTTTMMMMMMMRRQDY